jgi:hypothetical protein
VIKYQILPKILLCFFFLVAMSNLLAADKDIIVIKDLSEEFLVYDIQYATYVPYTDGKVSSKSVFLDFNPYRGYYLNIEALPGLSLFLNQKLVYENTSTELENLMLEVDKIIPIGSEKQLLTLYHKEGKVPISLKLCNISNEPVFQNTLLWQTRHNSIVNKELVFFLFVLIIVLFIILRNRFGRHFFATIGIGQNGNSPENLSLLGVFTVPRLLILLFNALGFTFIIAESGIRIPYFEPVQDIAITIIAFLGLFYLKYFYLGIIGLVFQSKSLAKAHFNEIVRVALYMNLLLVPIFALIYFSQLLDWTISYIGFLVIIVGGMLFTIVRLLVITFSMPQVNYVYLFSYLCIAEIIPLAFVIKITLLTNLDL